MRALTMAVTEGYWQSLLEAIYTAFEDRDTAGYAWLPTDRWTQSRNAMNWTGHLECWADLGGAIRPLGHAFEHSALLAFAVRYQADDDSLSQARMHAAIRDACECLLRLVLPHGCRVQRVEGIELQGPLSSGHVECSIRFTLHVPR